MPSNAPGLLTRISQRFSVVFTSGWPLFFWIQPKFEFSEITSQKGKVILITGANSGIGLVTARELYKAGAKLYMACRTESKAREAMASISYTSSTGSLEFLHLDLADLESVTRAAKEVLDKEKRLDMVIANAGIMATPEGEHTKQGYTLQFGSNVIGHQALISALLPLLLSTSRSSSEPARVITLSSLGHESAPRGGIDYHSLIADPEILAKIEKGQDYPAVRGKKELDKWTEYGQSKWGDIALAKYLESVYGPHAEEGMQSRRVAEGELITFAVHPGLIQTNLANHLGLAGLILKYAPWLAKTIVRTPDVGAGNQLWAATMPLEQARDLSGAYIVPYQRVGYPRSDVLDPANQVRMWDWCEQEVAKHS